MASAPKHHVALIDKMNSEWRSIGRSPAAVRAWRAVAGRDPGLSRLVFGDGTGPPACPTPLHMVEHMRRASGPAQRDEAARLFGVLLRESPEDPMFGRMLVQLLLPGLVSVARRLQWGRGGEWHDGEEFFGELVTTSWLVVDEWSGQNRPYAVLDLLSAIRCRVRRQLFRAKEAGQRTELLDPEWAEQRPARPESDLEQLARLLLEHQRDGTQRDEMQILYAHHVLGYSMKELAALTGRERRDPLGPPGPRPPSAPRVIQGATGMSVAYRVQVGGWRSGGLRRRAAAGSPNWWVILAVSLALMALLVGATGAPASTARGAGVARGGGQRHCRPR